MKEVKAETKKADKSPTHIDDDSSVKFRRFSEQRANQRRLPGTHVTHYRNQLTSSDFKVDAEMRKKNLIINNKFVSFLRCVYMSVTL